MELIVLNYEIAELHRITLSQETYERYANDTDSLVYGVLGYKESEVSYMIGEITEKSYDECEIEGLYAKD